MSASDTERRANASNAKRTANIMPINVIARWASQGALREGSMSAARSPCCASAGAQATNSEMPERRARTISETPARRGRWTRLGRAMERIEALADRAVIARETAPEIVHPAICATRRLRRYRGSFNWGKVARDGDMKYAEARSPSEADHPVGEDGEGVRLSEEQRLDWLCK